jgi:hypothetical protein
MKRNVRSNSGYNRSSYLISVVLPENAQIFDTETLVKQFIIIVVPFNSAR